MQVTEQAKGKKDEFATDQDKAVLSAVVEGFIFAIVEVCQTLEHQKSLPLEPHAFSVEFKNRAVNMPNDTRGNLIRTILMNLSNALDSKPLAPLPFR